MSDAGLDVLAARAARDAARLAFDNRVAALKGDLAERGIGTRIADDLVEKANQGLAEAIEIADSNRGVIAGTIAALALWLLRRPLTGLVLGWLGRDDLINGGLQE
ncbi:MAG: hypothetical protein IT550_04125 [Novosphingobium sp.]|jgi:hypothetical protein|nr:hypothetical protein [Novosphingobium sp.]